MKSIKTYLVINSLWSLFNMYRRRLAMKKSIISLVAVAIAFLFLYGCGGGEKYYTSDEITDFNCYELGDPITKAQEKVNWARLYISKKKYDEALKALEEANNILEVANSCDLSLINAKIHLYQALMNIEENRISQARDELGKAESDASQAVDMLPEAQKAELQTLLTEMRESFQSMQVKGEEKEQTEKIFKFYKDLSKIISMRSEREEE